MLVDCVPNPVISYHFPPTDNTLPKLSASAEDVSFHHFQLLFPGGAPVWVGLGNSCHDLQSIWVSPSLLPCSSCNTVFFFSCSVVWKLAELSYCYKLYMKTFSTLRDIAEDECLPLFQTGSIPLMVAVLSVSLLPCGRLFQSLSTVSPKSHRSFSSSSALRHSPSLFLHYQCAWTLCILFVLSWPVYCVVLTVHLWGNVSLFSLAVWWCAMS